VLHIVCGKRLFDPRLPKHELHQVEIPTVQIDIAIDLYDRTQMLSRFRQGIGVTQIPIFEMIGEDGPLVFDRHSWKVTQSPKLTLAKNVGWEFKGIRRGMADTHTPKQGCRRKEAKEETVRER
jgi:hypothetical protein